MLSRGPYLCFKSHLCCLSLHSGSLSFEFDIEQDALMCSFLLFAGIPVSVEKLSWGHLLDRGCLSERGTDTNLIL